MRRGATKRQDGTGQDRTPRRFDHEALARARTELGLTQERDAAGSDGLARSAEALRAAHGFAALPP